MPLQRRPDFRELVRRGVIDPRKLPHRLRQEVADELDRRTEELLQRQRERHAAEPPF